MGVKPRFTIRSAMLPPLVVGFTLPAVGVFALAHLGGLAFRSAFSLPVDVLLVIALLFFAAIDLTFPRLRPTLLRRQASRSLSGRFPLPMAGFLWGADTGSVFSTFRASAASWGALALSFAGWGPWWVGIAYAVAFCLPLAALIATYPVAGPAEGARGWRHRSTESVVVTLGDTLEYIRLASVAIALTAITVTLAAGIQ